MERQSPNPLQPRLKKGLILAVLIVLGFLGLLFIPSLFNINTYRQQIADQIEQRLGRQIVLGSLSLSLLPTVKISARDVSISDDPKFAQGAFIKAQSAAFKVRFGSLLRGNPEVSSIELNSPEVTLIREKTGEWNWKTLKPLQPAGQGLAIGSMGVAVHRGRLTLIDRRQPIAAESNSPIDLEVSGLNLNFDQAAVTASPFRITLGKQVVVEVAKLSLLNHGQQRVQLEAELQNAPLNELIDLAGSFGIHSGFTGTGVVRLKATIDADLAKPDAATVIVVQGVLSEAQLQIPRLKQPLAVASAEISIKSDSLRLENLKAQLGSSHITGWTQLQKLSQIVANFDLQLDQLNVNELQQLVAENEVPSSKPGKPQTSLPSPFIADGKLTVGRVMLDKFEVTNLQSQVNFKEQVIDLNVLNARFCGGQYQGQVRINQTQSNSGIDLNGRFGGVNVNQFLSAVSSSKSDVYGQASGTLNVHSREQQFDLNSATGNGSLQVTNGRVASFDLVRQIQVLSKLAGLTSDGTGTEFRSLSTSLRFSPGRIYTDNLRMEMNQLAVTGRGLLLLGDPVMTNHDLLAQLSSAKSGERESGSVSDLLLNQVKVGVPLKMSGPITQPTFALSAQGVGNHLTDRLFKQQDETIKGVFDLFTNKKKRKR